MATRIFGLLILSLLLAACVTAATSAATEAVYVGAQERSLNDASSDGRIQMLLDDKLFKYQVDLFRAVTTTVIEGRVLLTGNVPKAEDRVKATELAWEVPGVKQVMNELQTRADPGIGNDARDSWIIAKLRTQMMFANDVVSINYNLDCVNGIAYVMGIAQSQAELDHVRDIVRHTEGVKDVVSYVRLKTDLPNPLVTGKPITS